MANLQQIKICVYKITSPSKRVYIGSTINFQSRIRYYKTLRCQSQPRLYRSFVKYGFDKHKIEVLCECDIENVRQTEAYYGHLYNCLGEHGLNCNLPPHGSGFISKSEQTLIKIGNAARGREVTLETREKHRIALIGKVCSIETRKKISASNSGKKLSDERKKRISQIMMGHKMSKESIRKGVIKRSHIFLNIETGIYYCGRKEAAFSIGISESAFANRMWRKKRYMPFIVTREEDGH